MMNGWDGGMTTAGWILMSLFWVLLIVVIIWAVARLLPGQREGTREPEPDPERDDPQAILDRRLARGEIDPETYDTLSEKLRTHAMSGGG